MDYFLLVLGLVLLVSGADALVKGAARLASSIGIPSLVIGLTVVAFGTSAPELAVSINSVVSNKTELAIANVIGSNIFNILFILGLAAIITPLTISKQLIRQDVPIMVMISALVFYMLTDAHLSVLESGVLVILLLTYTTFLFIQGKSTENDTLETKNDEVDSLISGSFPMWQSALWLIFGLILLIIGSNLLVNSAVNIARAFGVSEAIIGLTIIAIGTSLPEVVTSIVASVKGQRDIAVGNVIGSNTFNLLAVLGISGVISDHGMMGGAQLVQQDLPIMLGVAVLCLPLMFTGAVLSRLEGALFFGLYVVYSAFLIGSVKNSDWLSTLTDITWKLIIPITLVVIAISLIRDFRSKKALQN
jgi:cation:H+ antiporter